MNRCRHLILTFGLSMLVVSCMTKGTRFDIDEKSTATEAAALSTAPSRGAIDPAWLRPPTDEYTLGPGDKLEIEILGESGTRETTFVAPDGRLYYNLASGLDVKGRTTSEVRSSLEQTLRRYYRNPQVSVTLVDAVSQRVSVLGRLNAPGVYSLKQPLRVLDAVSQAGGLFTSRFTGTTEELADLPHSFLVRKGQVLPVDFQKLLRDGDMSQNIYLKPGDFIYLPSSLTTEVYVLGAVVEPRPVGFMNEMNLMAAIGRGLGMRPDADLTKVSIIRGSLVSPKVAVVNVKDVIAGKRPNVRLEPGDIVYVPSTGSGKLSLTRYLTDAVNTFVRVVAANEGGNAAVPNAEPTGVNIDIGGNKSSN